MNEKSILEKLEEMLIREKKSTVASSGNKSTVYDYKKRILAICKHENIEPLYVRIVVVSTFFLFG